MDKESIIAKLEVLENQSMDLSQDFSEDKYAALVKVTESFIKEIPLKDFDDDIGHRIIVLVSRINYAEKKAKSIVA